MSSETKDRKKIKQEMSSETHKPSSQTVTASETDKGKANLSDDDGVDTSCGLWIFRPSLLQPCAKVGVFSGVFSLSVLMTSTLTTYVNSQVTTLERQFGFSSHQTGIILAANDIGYLVCVLFMGYCASRIHIPRWLGVATITFGVSGIACSLPHFLFGASVNVDPTADSSNGTGAVLDRGKISAVFGQLCETLNDTSDFCQLAAEQRAARPASMAPHEFASISLVIIVIGMALQGFGKAPRMLFTVTYLDDNTSKFNTGFYMGIITAMAVLGPAIAFVVGGIFNEMYVTLEATKLTPRHPKWIGAWWLGYVVFGVVSLIIAVPLFFFPPRLPRKKSPEKNLEDQPSKSPISSIDLAMSYKPSTKPATDLPEASNNLSGQETSTVRRFSLKFLLRHCRDFLASLYRLLTNPLYVCVVTSNCFILFTVSGSMAYTPKYMESMFHLPARQANFIMALETLCTSCVGTFIGGYLTRRLKMTAISALKFTIIVTVISVSAQSLGFVFKCEQPDVNNWPGDETACNNGCNCQNNSYFPLCGDNGRTYYSPCQAGCVQVENGVYQNCTCIPEGRATAGTCYYGCYHIYTYSVAKGVMLIFGTQTIIPKLIVLIRCVSAQDKAMALAVSTFMTTLLGWLLGPIVFGNVIDSICMIWDINCDTRGRCLLYDNSQFRIQLHGYCTIGVGCATVFLCLAYLYARCTHFLDDADGAGARATKGAGEMSLVINGGGSPIRKEGIDNIGMEDIDKN